MIVDIYEVRPVIMLPGGAKVVGLMPEEQGRAARVIVEYPEPGNGKLENRFEFLGSGSSFLLGTYIGVVPGRGLLYWIR